MDKISIKEFTIDSMKIIWEKGYTKFDPEWKKWNGPYFEDYHVYENFEDFESEKSQFFLGPLCKCILVNNIPVGMVSQNWIDKKTCWLEMGISIYDEDYWSSGVGSKALILWTDFLFLSYPEIEHLGLTTWSGHKAMMRVSEKIGFKKEAQIRKVRFWQGEYFDSVKYGILRDEWEVLKYQLN